MPTTQELKDKKALEDAALEAKKQADLAAQQERQDLINELDDIINDSEQMDNAELLLNGVDAAQMTVTLWPPSGEAMKAILKTVDGTKYEFNSRVNSSDTLTAMISAGIAVSREAIEERKTEILNKLA